MKRCEYLVAREGKQIVGAISLFFEDKTCKIDDLAIKQEYQGKGIGTKLTERAEGIAKRRGCNKMWCFSSKDLNACGFYLKLGYNLEKIMKKHFERRDILYFGKILKST